jgi:hypothetical protein
VNKFNKRRHVQEWIILIRFKSSKNNEIIDMNNNDIINKKHELDNKHKFDNKHELDNKHEFDIINVNVKNVIPRKNLELMMIDCRWWLSLLSNSRDMSCQDWENW